MKCLVTGGLGFIGSNLVDRLIKDGHQVVVIDNLSTGDIKNINPKAKLILADLTDRKSLEMTFRAEKPDYVFHLAALPRVPRSVEDPVGTNDINQSVYIHLLTLARDNGVKRVIYSASSSAYGANQTIPSNEDLKCQPLSPYGLQKYYCEGWSKMFSDIYGLDTVNLRYFNVIGRRQPTEGAYCLVLGVFLRQKANKEKLTVFGDGTQTRDFTPVDDIVEGNIKAMEYKGKLNGEVINLGTGIETSVNQVAKMVGGDIQYMPNPREKFEEKRKVADNSKAKKILGWEPKYTIQEVIKELKGE